jgi:hypothetical protein
MWRRSPGWWAALRPPRRALVAFAYLKPAGQFKLEDACLGPLAEYDTGHAALYRRRA